MMVSDGNEKEETTEMVEDVRRPTNLVGCPRRRVVGR